MIYGDIISRDPKSKISRSISTSRTATNITLKIGDNVYHAKREILASRSRVLEDFLKQNTSNMVKIVGVNPSIMEIILNFMHTDKLEMTCQNMIYIYAAAQKLRMNEIIIKCFQVLREKTSKGLIYRYAVSWKKDLKAEKFRSLCSILRNLEQCLKGDDYLDLNIDQMCEIVTWGFMNSEEYSAKNRFLLFMMCVNWIDNKIEVRMRYAVRLMTCVQFETMQRGEIEQCSSHPSACFLMQLPEVKYMVCSALRKLRNPYYIGRTKSYAETDSTDTNSTGTDDEEQELEYRPCPQDIVSTTSKGSTSESSTTNSCLIIDRCSYTELK